MLIADLAGIRTGGERMQYSDATVAEVRGILKDRAANRGLITYGELCERVETADLHPHVGPLRHILGDISTGEVDAGRGMLSCLVVSKVDHSPGTGFFELAEELYGSRIQDSFEFWRKESAKVCNYWKAQRR